MPLRSSFAAPVLRVCHPRDSASAAFAFRICRLSKKRPGAGRIAGRTLPMPSHTSSPCIYGCGRSVSTDSDVPRYDAGARCRRSSDGQSTALV